MVAKDTKGQFTRMMWKMYFSFWESTVLVGIQDKLPKNDQKITSLRDSDYDSLYNGFIKKLKPYY